jgi:hypothetical protein
MNYPPYLHITAGRIRVKITAIKGSTVKAAKVAEELLDVRGVTHAKANPLTGNVLVLFDADTLTSEQVLGLLRKHGSSARIKNIALRPTTVSKLQPTPQSGNWNETLMNLLVQTALEIALKRLIFALI